MQLIAELTGAFCLVFAGCGAIVINEHIGAVVEFEAMFAGPICGASMNPARSLGPALVSGEFVYIWMYLLAPTLGALLAVPVCHYMRGE